MPPPSRPTTLPKETVTISEEDRKKLDELIEKLSDDDPKVREEATTKLVEEAKDPTKGAYIIEQTSSSSDPEVRARGDIVAEAVHWNMEFERVFRAAGEMGWKLDETDEWFKILHRENEMFRKYFWDSYQQYLEEKGREP